MPKPARVEAFKASTPQIVSKSWGHEKIIFNGQYCLKVLVFHARTNSSFHYHKKKHETFYVQKGEILFGVCNSDDPSSLVEHRLREGESFTVPPGVRHQFYAITEAEILEGSTFHDEADTVRVLPILVIERALVSS